MTNTKASSSAAVDRRDFLRKSALSAVAVGALAACGRDDAQVASAAAVPASDPHAAPAPTTTAAAAVTTESKAEEMDRMHEAGIKSFPAKTTGKGGLPLAPRLDKGVKVYELTATETRWEV